MADSVSVTALWWAVIASGIYHGINPGMGWPLSVSAALMSGRVSQLPVALGMLAFGHLLAMLVILLPFSMLASLVEKQRELRLATSVIVILMGVYLLWNRRHPKYLARVHPARLALWSFLAAMAHGAGLMLVPVYLGLGGKAMTGAGHGAAHGLMAANTMTAIGVAFVHTIAMSIAGATIAAVIYFWLGLRFLSKTWFNLDVVWALSLVLVGGISLYGTL